MPSDPSGVGGLTPLISLRFRGASSDSESFMRRILLACLPFQRTGIPISSSCDSCPPLSLSLWTSLFFPLAKREIRGDFNSSSSSVTTISSGSNLIAATSLVSLLSLILRESGLGDGCFLALERRELEPIFP